MGEAAQAAALAADVPGEVTAEMLRATFEDWRICTRDGRWHALRGGAAAEDGPRSLIRCFVSALTLQGLGEQLSLQEWLRRMTEQELGAVWHGGLGAVAR